MCIRDSFNIVFVFQQRPKSLSNDLVVFRQQDGNSFHSYQSLVLAIVISAASLPPDVRSVSGTCATTVVPLPGVDVTVKLPPTISNRSLMLSSPNRLPFLACTMRSARK